MDHPLAEMALGDGCQQSAGGFFQTVQGLTQKPGQLSAEGSLVAVRHRLDLLVQIDRQVHTVDDHAVTTSCVWTSMLCRHL